MVQPSTIPAPFIGASVLFHEEGGPYASLVTALNPDGTVELVTFGRNSVYFQHNVKDYKPGITGTLKGTWTWPGSRN